MRASRSRLLPSGQDHAVAADMNITPLIDVMLVLLIMMILTIPVMYHKVPVDLPQGVGGGAAPPVHRLDLDAAGRLSWDGAAISTASLPGHLAALKSDPARPELHLSTHGETPYVRFDETVAAIKRAGIDRLGLVGNARFAASVR